MEEDIERNKSISPSERKKSLEDLKKEFSDGIPKCGTDALRFGLCTYDVKGKENDLCLLCSVFSGS
jgi:valyl-tRNA synthetase